MRLCCPLQRGVRQRAKQSSKTRYKRESLTMEVPIYTDHLACRCSKDDVAMPCVPGLTVTFVLVPVVQRPALFTAAIWIPEPLNEGTQRICYV
jgi:hypothetical protein